MHISLLACVGKLFRRIPIRYICRLVSFVSAIGVYTVAYCSTSLDITHPLSNTSDASHLTRRYALARTNYRL